MLKASRVGPCLSPILVLGQPLDSPSVSTEPRKPQEILYRPRDTLGTCVATNDVLERCRNATKCCSGSSPSAVLKIPTLGGLGGLGRGWGLELYRFQLE